MIDRDILHHLKGINLFLKQCLLTPNQSHLEMNKVIIILLLVLSVKHIRNIDLQPLYLCNFSIKIMTKSLLFKIELDHFIILSTHVIDLVMSLFFFSNPLSFSMIRNTHYLSFLIFYFFTLQKRAILQSITLVVPRNKFHFQ